MGYFRFYSIVFTVISFPFVLDGWYKGHPFFSAFFLLSLLQCVLVSCFIGFWGGLYSITTKRFLRDFWSDSFLTRTLRWFLAGLFISPVCSLYLLWKTGEAPKITLWNTLIYFLLVTVFSILLAIMQTIQDGMMGNLPDEKKNRPSRKQRERLARKTQKIEQEQL